MPRQDQNQTATPAPKIYVGIDNGVSGSIGIISIGNAGTVSALYKTPVHKVLNYTKTKQWLNRIDGYELEDILRFPTPPPYQVICLIERPMVNPTRFKATISAIRALEATLIILESLDIPYQYIDSKEWQKELLPKGLKGTDELKRASAEVATRLFPHLKEEIRKQKDGDGILIAEYAKRKGL